MIAEVAVTNLPHLLLIASDQQARTPAFERAVASAKAAHLSLTVMALDAQTPQNVGSPVERGFLSARRQRGGWLESEIEIERNKGLDVSLGWAVAGKVRSAINDYLKAALPDMLIKDIHREPTLRRSFLSPLDWHLLRQCVCPIQLVTQPSAHVPRRILAAVNLFRSNDVHLHMNDQLLCAASRLANVYSAELHVVYVYDWAAICVAAATIFGAQPIEDQFQEALREGLEEAMVLLCEDYGVAHDQQHFLTGPALTTLRACAITMDIELLVIGNLAAHDEEKAMGSTAESLLVHAPCDVLVVKTQHPETRGFSEQDHAH